MHQMDFDDYDQQGKNVTKKSLGISSKDSQEDMLNKMMKGMKVGDYINGDDLEFINSNASIAIKNITRISNTEFKVNRTFAGRLAISSDAKITLVSKASITGNYIDKNGVMVKNATFTGVKVTSYGLPQQSVGGKYYNGYIINGNQAQTLVGKNIVGWNTNP